MNGIKRTSREGHEAYYKGFRREQNQGRIAAPGMQQLVHLFRGGYLGDDYRDGRGRKLLDVGCGSGFNSVTMAMLGWDVCGCEISPEIAAHARESMAGYGFDIPVEVGNNETLPYADGSFDFLLSMNVIHYAQSPEAMRNSVREYGRVLKPGGRILMFTITPESWLLERAKPVSENLMQVRREDDYRTDELLFVFRDKEELEGAFADVFEDIRIGTNRTDLFTRVLHHWLLTGARKDFTDDASRQNTNQS